MSPAAVVVMVAVCGLVWGGFTVLLTRAVRAEGRKTSHHPPHPSP